MRGLAIIIVNYQTPDLTIQSVDALDVARASFPDLLVVVVDGGSADGSAERLEHALAGREGVLLLALDVNGGFAFANNRAIAALADVRPLPEAIALINPDARIHPGAIEAMASLLDRQPSAGAVGGLLVQEDGKPQSSAFRFPSLRGEFCRGARLRVLERLLLVPASSILVDHATEVPWVTGAAVMLRTAALREAGLFDEGFFLYYEETELLLRLRRHGWSVWHEPAARIVHDGGAATQIRDPASGLPRAQRMPRYWYESRRRYLALAYGRPYVLFAGFAWLAGHVVWTLRQFVAPRDDKGAARSGLDFISFGWWPSRRDKIPHFIALGDEPPERPAWMAAGR